MIEAVSAILVCEDSIFAIQRQPHLRAFPGYHAFPGGKIDDCDRDGPAASVQMFELPADHFCALQRELLEELQFDLSAAHERGEIVSLTLFGEALTPAFEPVRFRAYYYKIVLSRRPNFELERNEILSAGWDAPAQWLAQYQRGTALMVVPMQNALKQLAENIQLSQAGSFNIETPADEIPCLELLQGLRYLPILSNTLRPATHTNAPLLGDPGTRQLLVDPSPKSDAVYQQLLTTLRRYPVDAILISHHHPDHHHHAMELARAQQLPVLMSAHTRCWLVRHFGKAYLEGVELEIIASGTAVCEWQGQPVRAYELPGHDEGMLGLAPDSLRWFFIADLAQSRGSILIPEEGGDLALYLESLRRVIDLNPDYILPSHGVLSGGTEILERTLRHRLQRHQQIDELRQKNQGDTQIVTELYPDLEARYQDFALQTVRQHLRLLEEQNPL